MSVEVRAQNTISMTSVKAIKDATDQSAQMLATMEQYAEDAGTTLTGIYQDAEDAKTNASNALASAQSASEYASRALGNLSTVQSVAETLAWIAQHGTMTLTTDVALDPTHIYFVQDAQGDYVVGGTHYAIVPEPDVADISTYYVLSIDESLNNYVATHLAVDSEGLWIIPDAGGNKVLVATGQGNTYTTAGTYVIGKVNNADTVLASFTANGIQIGDANDAHLMLDAISQNYIDALDNNWLSIIADISTSRTASDGYEVAGDGVKTDFYVNKPIVLLNSVKVDGVAKAEGIDFDRDGNGILFYTAPANGSTIKISYSTLNNNDTLYYTLGARNANGSKGIASVVEGLMNVASGEASHAEGRNAVASGDYSHAEGMATAQGEYSHAEGWSIAVGQGAHSEGGRRGSDHRVTYAGGDSSHAEGWNTYARGALSHAEGENTFTGNTATASHAEGYQSIANGAYSHAQNYATRTTYQSQTAIGKYNDNQATNAFEIGNGTDDNARSNAFSVDWSGNSEQQGHATTADMTAQEVDDFVDSLVVGGGGTAVDLVVEQGTSGIWTYRKWSSGIAECWGTRASISTGFISWANGWYYSYFSGIALPFTFLEIPVVTQHCYSSGGDIYATGASIGNYGGLATTTNTGGTTLYRAGSGTIAVVVQYYVVGRWK